MMKPQIKWIVVAMEMVTGNYNGEADSKYSSGCYNCGRRCRISRRCEKPECYSSANHWQEAQIQYRGWKHRSRKREERNLHDGGIMLKSATTTVELRNFIIDTTGTAPVLTRLVVANEGTVGRLPLFDLVLPSGITLPLKAKGSMKSLTLAGVSMKLTGGAATALNGAFSVTAFKAGLAIGTAKVQAFGLMNK